MKSLQRYFIILLVLSFMSACASVSQQAPARVNSLALVDISEGLPLDGQWRENIVLADMDGDGFLDIVAPPPRNAQKEQNQPHISIYDGRVWKKGAFTFPSLKGYDYGGIAVGDINRDGYPDIVLAVYEKRIILFENNKNNGFIEKPFPVKDSFHSRTVEVFDINRDGWDDIIALSQISISSNPSYKPEGILLGVNKDGKDWDVKFVEGSGGLFGDSMAIGDIRGNGNKDIIIAPLISNDKTAKLIWFGDGKVDFSVYDGGLISVSKMAHSVRAGDLDGDGKDEVVFKVYGFGKDTKAFLSAHKWTGNSFADISKGLELIEDPIVFNLADAEGNGKKELIVLSAKGISIYKYVDTGWIERGHYNLSSAETQYASDLKAGRNRDGSLLIVYSRGIMPTAIGMKAYLLK